jgi:hypothetical protein
MTIRWRYLVDVGARTLILLAAANVLFAAADPMPALGSLTLYNGLLPGRTRLPHGYQPAVANNLTIFNLNAIFASHEIAAPKPADEFRVVILGDSSIWGATLAEDETRTAFLNAHELTHAGMRVRFYNIGYPRFSAFKDLLLLHQAMGYDPDMVIWFVTLEALPADRQVYVEIVTHNASEARALIADYDLACAPDNPAFVDPWPWDRTIFGRRRDLADLIRLQVKGFGWAATGVDLYPPDSNNRPDNDLTDEQAFHGVAGPDFQPTDLAWDMLDAGREMTKGIILLMVNEPIFRADGENSDIRYNNLYPRWAYDSYRILMDAYTRSNGIAYLDLWDAVPADQFTNSSLHTSAEAEQGIALRIEGAMERIFAGSLEPR